MKWGIDYSREALKFIEEQNVGIQVKEELERFLIKMKGENINVDVKKLPGNWTGYYRLRKGSLRIIFEIDKTEKVLFVEKIDFRGGVYK